MNRVLTKPDPFSTWVPSVPCPNCGYRLDCAGSLDGPATPSPGDATVCIKCAAVLLFDAALIIRKPTPDQLKALLADPILRRIQQGVRSFNRTAR